jgi:hypothetical protein
MHGAETSTERKTNYMSISDAHIDEASLDFYTSQTDRNLAVDVYEQNDATSAAESAAA